MWSTIIRESLKMRFQRFTFSGAEIKFFINRFIYLFIFHKKQIYDQHKISQSKFGKRILCLSQRKVFLMPRKQGKCFFACFHRMNISCISNCDLKNRYSVENDLSSISDLKPCLMKFRSLSLKKLWNRAVMQLGIEIFPEVQIQITQLAKHSVLQVYILLRCLHYAISTTQMFPLPLDWTCQQETE